MARGGEKLFPRSECSGHSLVQESPKSTPNSVAVSSFGLGCRSPGLEALEDSLQPPSIQKRALLLLALNRSEIRTTPSLKTPGQAFVHYTEKDMP
jgi:hypothetical protein